MTLVDYIKHYLNLPQLLMFLFVSFCIVVMIHWILILVARKRTLVAVGRETSNATKQTKAKRFIHTFGVLTEAYYELMFSASSILFFVGIYFLISYNYFSVSEHTWQFWTNYEGYILLGFILISVLFNNFVDHVVVPLEKLDRETLGYLRMAGMLYMLVIFAYIKFVDQNSNYDTILGYFITLVIGRFIYFDASAKDFVASMKKIGEILPVLVLVLISTALLSLYGFKTEYLLRSNGVVVSLFIAHLCCIIEIMILHRTKIFERISERVISYREKQNTSDE